MKLGVVQTNFDITVYVHVTDCFIPHCLASKDSKLFRREDEEVIVYRSVDCPTSVSDRSATMVITRFSAVIIQLITKTNEQLGRRTELWRPVAVVHLN